MQETEEQVVEESPPPALYLVPYNNNAKRATADTNNEYFRSRMDNGAFALYISFANPEKQVFTLGRADCDIFLPDPRGADVSKHQCSFVNTERGAVLLEDKSSKKNTEPYSSNNGGQTVGFTRDTRRVLVARGINNMLGIGRDRFYQFEIHWESDGLYDFPYKDGNYRTGPQKSRQKRYIEGDHIGGGSYGNVWWVVDVHTGGLMAVKKFNSMDGKNLEFATREITNLFRINRTSSIHHNHILEILDYAGGGSGDNWGEVFMPLKPGNLKTLALDTTRTVDVGELADTVLRQMLLALACIAEHKIVHRDLKPENVLWEEGGEDGVYHFRLGDFGLSNNPDLAVTVAGTEPFMAPEVFHRGRQTEKVDIWSLFATIVWVRNVDNFRHHCARERPERIHHWLAQISTLPELRNIQRMASMRPRHRPSAKQLLRILAGEAEELDSLAGALTLGPGGSGGEEEDAGSAGSPAVPYYEPYVPENYDWRAEDEGEGSNAYVPPPTGASPRAAGAAGPLDEAFVKPYDETYGEPDSGTAVPDVWTARALPTQEMKQVTAAEVPQTAERRAGRARGRGRRDRNLLVCAPGFQDHLSITMSSYGMADTTRPAL